MIIRDYVIKCWVSHIERGKRVRRWMRHAGGSWPSSHRGARRLYYGAHSVAVVVCAAIPLGIAYRELTTNPPVFDGFPPPPAEIARENVVEPSSIAVLIPGLAGVLYLRRRISRKGNQNDD